MSCNRCATLALDRAPRCNGASAHSRGHRQREFVAVPDGDTRSCDFILPANALRPVDTLARRTDHFLDQPLQLVARCRPKLLPKSFRPVRLDNGRHPALSNAEKAAISLHWWAAGSRGCVLENG